jgi:hypothetical protein
MHLTAVPAVITRDCVATSPLKGEVNLLLLPRGEKVPEGRMRGRFGIERQAFHRYFLDFSIFSFPGVLCLKVASPPSSGPAGHLLPGGEKREVADPSTLQATPGKSAVGLLVWFTWPGRWKVPMTK